MPVASPDFPDARRAGFILIPGFALTSFSLAIEALSVVNQIAGTELYPYTLYSGDPERRQSTVCSSNRVPIRTTAHFSDCEDCDLLVVCAHRNAARHGNAELNRTLRRQNRRGGRIVALSNGSLILARAGVLTERGCTLVGQDMAVFKELYPEIPVRQQLYTVDGNILTCAGGTTALDLFLYIIGVDFGADTAIQVSYQFVQDRIRSPEEIQNARRSLERRMQSPVLGAAIEVMESNLEKPYAIGRLAREVGTTTRTLENLFRRFEHTTPGAYYLDLRLESARRMLEQTNLPIATIAQATGFSSQSYFSRRFREGFGLQPRALRQQQKY